MRTNKILAAALLAAAALTACDKDNGGTQPEDGRTPVRFAADIERSATPATRAAGTAWEADDAIGIFMVKLGTTTVAGGAENRQYTTATTAGEFTPAAGNEIFYPQDGTAVDFIAYYPHRDGATLGTRLPIEVATAQTTENQPDFDLLYSDNASDFGKWSTDAVGLTFKHALSKFVIKPTNGAGVKDEELAAMTVKIEGMNITGSIDLTNGLVNINVAAADITPRTVEAGKLYDAIIIPDYYRAEAVKVYFTIGTDVFTWTLDAEIFKGGNEYVYTVTLSRTPVGNEATVTGTIKPWETNDGGNVTVTPDEDIDNVLTEIEDDNFRDAVTILMTNEGWDKNTDGKLSPAEAAAVTGTMDVSNKSIASLAGIEYFTGLTVLNCSGNTLTALNVSKNTALTALDCHYNALDALDVSANTALTALNCGANALTVLDVSNNTALTGLDCYNNALDALDVSALTALTRLSCNANALTALDVTKNTALTTLNCSDNALDVLDVSKNTALTTLDCSDNTLDALDVSANTALTILNCYNNDLAALDVSKNTALIRLFCYGNALTTLDVSANTALTSLNCGDGSTELTVTVDAEAHDISTDGNLNVSASYGYGNDASKRITELDTPVNNVTVVEDADGGDPNTDTTAPTVVSTMPAGGSQNAPTSGEIVVTFSEEMNPAFGKVAYTKGGNDIYHPLSGGAWSEGNTVYTVAYSGLEPGTQYMFPVYEFQDMAGNVMTMEAPYITTVVVPDTPITAAPITGIVKPVTGATPSTVIDNGTGYTAEITGWFEVMNTVNGNFAAEKVYTAMVRLTVAEGYSLEGFAAADAQGFKPDDAASIRVDGSVENPLYLQITYSATAAAPSGDSITIGGADDENEDWED